MIKLNQNCFGNPLHATHNHFKTQSVSLVSWDQSRLFAPTESQESQSDIGEQNRTFVDPFLDPVPLVPLQSQFVVAFIFMKIFNKS